MSEKSTRTYLDVFKHILSDGESVFPFSRASNEYDLSNLSNVKFRAGGVEHPVSKLELVAKEVAVVDQKSSGQSRAAQGGAAVVDCGQYKRHRDGGRGLQQRDLSGAVGAVQRGVPFGYDAGGCAGIHSGRAG